MKKLRRAVLSRIRDDTVLSRQHWTATGGWKRRILAFISWYVVLPVSGVLIGALVAALGALLGSGDVDPAPVDSYQLAIGGLATFIAFAHAFGILRELIGARSLAVASVLPDSDRSYATGRLVKSLQKTSLFLAGALLHGGGIAFGAELNVADTAQVMLLSILLWAMVASLSVILSAFLPVLARQEVVAALPALVILLVLSAAALVSFGFARQETIIFATLAALPTGWPILMIKYGVMLKQPEYWLLLIPAGCLLMFAAFSWFRLLSRYRIQEFSYEPGSLAIAEFQLAENQASTNEQTVLQSSDGDLADATGQLQPTDTSSWLRNCNRRLKRWLKLPGAEEPVAELTPDQAIARIHESGLTKRFAWTESGFVERALARILGDEELLSADILSCGEPKWSAAMTKSLVPAAAAVMMVVLAALVFDRKIAVISGHVALGGMIGTFAGSKLVSQWRSNSGEFCSALAILPIDAPRVSRMLMTLGAIRSILISPMAFGVALAITWGHSGRIEVIESAIFGAKAVFVLFLLHQWWFLIMQPYAHSKSVMRTIVDVVLGILVIGAMIAGICLMLTSGRDETLSTLAAGLAFGGGWIAQTVQRRRLLNSPTDFVVQMQTQKTTAQRQNKQPGRVPTFWPKPVEQLEPLS
jgi:hypothetical protein